MLVSFIIIAYNAEKVIDRCLESLKKQDYSHKKVEVIFVDSNSQDATKSKMLEFQNENSHDFEKILVLDNPQKTLPCGWNIALQKATGEAILRVDAHSSFGKEFISQNVTELLKGEDIVGGHRISVCEEKTSWERTLLLAEKSLFGSGIARYRRSEKREYVKTLAHAMYRKKVFDDVGLYNEKLARTEDNEMHYRMREKGYKFLLSPNIISYHHVRNTLRGMIKQKYENGKWIGITLKYCSKCFSLYHFAPMFFVLGIIFSSVMAIVFSPFFLLILFGLYGLFSLVSLVSILKNNGFKMVYFLIPFILFILHLMYGIGTIVGLGTSKRKIETNTQEEIYQYNDKTLRELQLKSLEMFCYLKRFCEEHHLLIYFCGGCCIGTIRHKGFIPWDDDIDVFMPRDDYEKLKQIWNKEADTEKYACIFPTKEVRTRNQFLTINDNYSTFIKIHQKDLDINHGIVIDVLPLDGCPSSRIKRRIQKFWALIYALYITEMIPQNHGKFVTVVGKIMLGMVPSKKIRYRIWKLAEKKMTKYKIQDCNYVTELCSGPRYMQNEYPKALFEKAIYKEFEGQEMPIPIGYDEYLKIAFGDYQTLPPKEKQIPEHNVVYCDVNRSYTEYKGIYYCKEGGKQ